MSRITDSGAGYVASYYLTFLPEGNHSIIHTARRDWAQKNAVAVKAFREAVIEGAAFMAKPANNDKMRAIVGKYIKVPPEVLAKMTISPPGPTVSEKQLNFWVNMMKDQDLLKTTPNVSQLLVK
jgi:NitT/TauT family transport system substrate-binding protein